MKARRNVPPLGMDSAYYFRSRARVRTGIRVYSRFVRNTASYARPSLEL